MARNDIHLLRKLNIDRGVLRTDVVPVKSGEVDYELLAIRLRDESVGERSAAAELSRTWPVGIDTLDPEGRGSAFRCTVARELDARIRDLNQIDGLEILCEYDGRVPLLPASYPISIDLRQYTRSGDPPMKLVSEIEDIENHRG